MTTVIRATTLGKRYELGRGRAIRKDRTLRESLMEGAGEMVRGLRAGAARVEEREFWALRDVSFEIAHGEAVGVIGGNGAGKSTLLKLLSRVTAPTTGRCEIRGRVGSLLEVGTGFHPDLTGRENVFLNGAILGMRQREIARKFDEIVAFAEVEQFIDTQVKRYSSGMYLRLAFSVAAHLEPEVLLVDEVLAVGDAAFQKKCLGKMGDVAAAGRTVLFVSHNMDAVQRLCARAMLVDRGRIAADGDSRDITARYVLHGTPSRGPDQRLDLAEAARSGTGDVRFVAVSYRCIGGGAARAPLPDAPIEFDLELDAERRLSLGSLAVVISDRRGTKLVNADTVALGAVIPLDAGRNRVRVGIDALHLKPGSYVVGLWAADGLGTAYDFVERALELEVASDAPQALGVTPRSNGLVTCRFTASRLPPNGS
ncbi:MAG: ABC transporter ATP-binding protein [Gemmatimonadaceae bacterium]